MAPFPRPGPEQMDRLLSVLRPFYPLARPVFFGWENLPRDRPLLFVGNHTIYGILDVPFLYAELYRREGILLRSLGDHLHFRVPLWRELLVSGGVVRGTRENCAALMDQGECVMVFPGGAREVAKRRGERYQLTWKERIGFATMALRHRCTIVPFSAVGVEDSFEILADANDVLRSPAGVVARRLGLREDAIFPIPRSFRPERLYFRIGEPIRMDRFDGRTDEEAAWELRGEVATAITSGIEWLIQERERDPARHAFPRPSLEGGLRGVLSRLREAPARHTTMR